MRILLFLLLPVLSFGQINRAYGVIEIGSFPTSSSTGPKFAYRPADSSFYRWKHTNVWVKVVEPSITPDTLYLQQISGTQAVVNGDTINLRPYLLKTDTTSLLTSYINLAGWGLSKVGKTLFIDSSKVATKHYTNTTFLPILGGTLTGTGGAGFIGFPAQGSTPSTPSSGFRMFANGAHNLGMVDRNGWITTFDISATANRFFTMPSQDGTFTVGAGTTNRVPLWTATNTLGNSNIQDNGTAVSILNSKPFLLPQWTTVGRPTGTSGYMGWRDGTTLEWYNGTRWAAALESTARTFSSGIIPYMNSNGQLTGSYSDIYFAATEFVCYRAPYFSSNQAGIAGGIRVYNTNTASSAGYASVALYPSTGGSFAQFFATNNTYPGYGVILANTFGHYGNGTGGLALQSDNAASSIRFGIGTTGTIEKMRINSTGVGIGRTATADALEVQGNAEFYGRGDGIVYVGSYPVTGAPDASVNRTAFMYNTNSRFAIFSGAGFSVNDDILIHSTSTQKMSFRSINDTVRDINFSKSAFFRQSIIIGSDSTLRFNPVNDLLILSKYGTQTKEAADLSKTFGNVAAFATDGTVLDYRITRDTSTSNADFTVTSTLLSSCQELFISAEVTSSATDTVNIILPTPSATYKNNKVYVFGDDDSTTQWVATKSVNATGLYYSNGGVKPTATNYAAVTTTTGVSGVTYAWICTRRNSGTWHWVLVRQ